MADEAPRQSSTSQPAVDADTWLDWLMARISEEQQGRAAQAGVVPDALRGMAAGLNRGTDQAQRQAMAAQAGPFGLLARGATGLHYAGRDLGDHLQATHGSRAGADPISKGAEGQAAWAEAEALLNAARQAKAQALMRQLFLGPVARR